MTDFSFIAIWWLILCLTGFVFLPIASIFFSSFVDKGYAFAKILGVMLVSYLVYVFTTVHVIAFTSWAIFLVFIVLGCFSLFYLPRKYVKKTDLQPAWKLFIFEEILFFIMLWLWSYVRSFNPDIFGLEKYMDFGFVNSILRTDYFPPKDMWFSPFPINYYYFGHLMTAVLTKISGISPYISYNLMLASVFAFAFTGSFSIGLTLWSHAKNAFKPIRIVFFAGLLTACLVTFSGNLHVFYSFFKPYSNEKPVPVWELEFSLFNSKKITQTKQIQDPKTKELRTITYTPFFLFPNAYWYPNATRFIYNTIHEFPMYSWVVADLHGHVLDIPIVLITIAFLLSLFLKYQSTIGNWKFEIGNLLVVGFLLAIMYMTNAWDSLTYLLLSGTLLLFLQWERVQKERAEHTTNNLLLSIFYVFLPKPFTQRVKTFLQKHLYIDLFSGLCISLCIILSSYLIFSLPFSVFFNPSQIVSGIGVLCAPKFLTDKGKIGPLLFEKDHCQKSPWWQLLTLYGFFYFFTISFLCFLSRMKKWTRADMFVLLLSFVATILIILPEFVYMKDIYPAHYRANTMFKLVFQAFILLSIASGYIIVRIVSSMKQEILRTKRSTYKILTTLFYTLYSILIVFLLFLVFTYPFLATGSYYGDLLTYRGLNGLTYLQKNHPSDFAGIIWLQQHVHGQPVILEAQGDSYTDFARVSANTGLPTVLGWTVHEWLWRGTYSIPAPRISEVQTLYETDDLDTAKRLLAKYTIQYIFIGDLERQKYTTLSEQKFLQLGEKVFSIGSTHIYRIK